MEKKTTFLVSNVRTLTQNRLSLPIKFALQPDQNLVSTIRPRHRAYSIKLFRWQDWHPFLTIFLIYKVTHLLNNLPGERSDLHTRKSLWLQCASHTRQLFMATRATHLLDNLPGERGVRSEEDLARHDGLHVGPDHRAHAGSLYAAVQLFAELSCSVEKISNTWTLLSRRNIISF